MRDGETAAFARGTLPVLRAQFDDARAIIAGLGNNGNGDKPAEDDEVLLAAE